MQSVACCSVYLRLSLRVLNHVLLLMSFISGRSLEACNALKYKTFILENS